jgi:hypothetical protein
VAEGHVGASADLQFKEKLSLGAFAGAEGFSNLDGAVKGAGLNSAGLGNTYYGGGLRVIPWKFLHIVGTYRKDSYDTSVTYNIAPAPDEKHSAPQSSKDDKKSAKTFGFSLEFHY